jgi:methylmalonyl-CoA mutase, C-terminal domain
MAQESPRRVAAMVERGATVRVLIGKVGFDPHDRGILVLTRGLRDAGMEVIFTGKFLTAEEVVAAAIQEGVDVIALSDHCGVMRLIAKDVLAELERHGATDICVVAGGIIPEEDKRALEAMGVTGNYGMGTPMAEIVGHIVERVNSRARKV